MGQDKADVLVAGRAMLDRVADALGPVCDRLVLLGPDRPGWDSWADSVHASGPLAGIATALARAVEPRVLVVAVDHAYATTSTLARLADVVSPHSVVPVDDTGVRQVTCAVYPTGIAAAAHDEAVAGGSIQTLLDRVSFRPVAPDEWGAWGEDGRSWFSVDSEEALTAGRARFGG